MFTLLYTGLQLWTWEVSWKRWLQVIFSRESRVVFSDRAQTEAEGVTNLGHFGNSFDFGLQTQILRPPQILLPNCWVTQTEALTQTMTKTVESGPIADGNHGEANENEGDAHDENNDEEDGVGVFLSHIFLRSLRHNSRALFLIILWDNNTSPYSSPFQVIYVDLYVFVQCPCLCLC